MKAIEKFSMGLAGTALLTVLISLPSTTHDRQTRLVKLSSLFTNVAEAQVGTGFINPRRSRQVQRTEGAGSRGCDSLGDAYLALLAPKEGTGLTVSSRPTFVWYVGNVTEAPIKFTLAEPGVIKPILVKTLNIKQPGIIALTPAEIPPLKVNKEYRWTVSIECNIQHPSENQYARATIERVPANLDKQISGANSEIKQAQLYAQAGIWYDAIASASRAYLTNPLDKNNSDYFYNLLDKAGLSKVVDEEKLRLANR